MERWMEMFNILVVDDDKNTRRFGNIVIFDDLRQEHRKG